MAFKHNLQNAFTEGSSYGSTGASLGFMVGGPKGALIGGGIGAGFGLLKGMFDDTELQEMAEAYARGEIDPQTQAYIEQTINERYDAIRRDRGAAAARRGVNEGTIGQKMMDEIYESEQNAIARAFAETSFARQQYGLSMLAQQDADRGAAVGSAIETLGNLYSYHQDKQHQDAMLKRMDDAREAGDKRWEDLMGMISQMQAGNGNPPNKQPGGGTAPEKGSFRLVPGIGVEGFESYRQSESPMATAFQNWRNNRTKTSMRSGGAEKGLLDKATTNMEGAFNVKTAY